MRRALSTTISEPGTGYSGPRTVFQKKKSSNILKNKTIVSVACQQALHLGKSRELTRHQK